MTDIDITIPTDEKPSRIKPRVKSGDTPPVSDFDPDDVSTVDSKITEFWSKYPEGRFETEVEVYRNEYDLPTFTVVARVWAVSEEDAPATVAHATRTLGEGEEPYSLRALEWAESVALGRALRFLGLGRNET